VNVLAVVHSEHGPAGTFADVVEERGHRLETWRPDVDPAPPPLVHDVVMVFGGGMHVDQEEQHPWLVEEGEYLRRLLERRVPLLGVCLGAQLVARAAGAAVGPAAESEIGWCTVERTADDSVLGVLPARFSAFQWHYYGFEVPAGARELARSPVCPQAFRLGDAAWGVQFHPEVTREIVAGWIEESPGEAPPGLLEETDERIAEWVRLGRELCGAFLEAAGRGERPPEHSLSPPEPPRF
jgi:GMP synthase (glutamine-hydrolysing)